MRPTARCTSSTCTAKRSNIRFPSPTTSSPTSTCKAATTAGRIYRLVSPGFVAASERSNRWANSARRNLSPIWHPKTAGSARRLSVCSSSTRVGLSFRRSKLVKRSPSALGRLHALYSLQGLDSLSDDLLTLALDGFRTPPPPCTPCGSASRDCGGHRFCLPPSHELADDGDPLVRFQVALSLGEASPAAIVEPLARLARHIDGDGFLKTAILTSVVATAQPLARRLMADEPFLRQNDAAGVPRRVVGRCGRPIRIRAGNRPFDRCVFREPCVPSGRHAPGTRSGFRAAAPRLRAFSRERTPRAASATRPPPPSGALGPSRSTKSGRAEIASRRSVCSPLRRTDRRPRWPRSSRRRRPPICSRRPWPLWPIKRTRRWAGSCWPAGGVSAPRPAAR